MKHLHERRKVTFQELGAVYAARGMLVAGVVTHSSEEGPKPGCHLFNMRTAGDGNVDCGTVGCIGGTMALVMGVDPGSFVGSPDRGQRQRNRPFNPELASDAFVPLFYPPGESRAWRNITAFQAVHAIDNWLKDGHPRWAKVLGAK